MQRAFGIVFIAALTIFSGILGNHFAYAETAEELQAKIQAQNAEIQRLTNEIAAVQKDLDATSKERQTLQSTIKGFDLSLQKTTANIKLTETKITQKNTEISQLSDTILDTSGKMDLERSVVIASIQSLDSLEGKGFASLFLTGNNLGDFFSSAATFSAVREALQEHIVALSELKDTLVTSKTTAEKKRDELASLKRDLSDQKAILNNERIAKAALLKETQNKESNYQKLLAQKQAQKAQFEADLSEFENQLRLVIDPSSIPRTGSGVLSWPLASVRITQYFGNTDFSTKNPQVYNGKGHNGIDLAASIGTKVMAARGGVVKGTGNTDLTCPNASYGQWVLVEHDNGLSTLYAHLSFIRVQQGDKVSTGSLLGYSGNTGYSTGPHLHFTVYATQGVQITDFPSKALACKGKIYHMPVADPKGYLNPLSYL